MTAKLVAKTKRPEAERAAENALAALFNCVELRRALRTKFAKVDLFGCDVMAKRPDGSKIWVQVTSGQMNAVLVRRKKLESKVWHSSDTVFVWQLVERADVANPRKKEWFFRVWELKKGKWYQDMDPIPVQREWFKARVEE